MVVDFIALVAVAVAAAVTTTAVVYVIKWSLLILTVLIERWWINTTLPNCCVRCVSLNNLIYRCVCICVILTFNYAQEIYCKLFAFLLCVSDRYRHYLCEQALLYSFAYNVVRWYTSSYKILSIAHCIVVIANFWLVLLKQSKFMHYLLLYCSSYSRLPLHTRSLYRITLLLQL